MKRNKLTCREELLQCAKELVLLKGENQFSINELVNTMIGKGSNFKESTMRTHITSKCCVDAPMNHNTNYNDYMRLGDGNYAIYNLKHKHI